MVKRKFGSTNLDVTPLGFGAAPIGFLKTEQDRVATILNLLLDEGINLIDTAAMYEGSESLIGQAVGHRRSEYVLVSKCGTRVPEISAPLWSAELISQTVDRALRNLRTDHLDVMLLHSCDLKTLQKGEALAALVKARDAGKVRFVGYSGDNQTAAYAASFPDVAVIETSISIADQANLQAVLPAAAEHQVGIIAKRPIANAAWMGVEGRSGFYGGYVKPYVDRLEQMNVAPTDIGFDSDGSDAWAEMALRFTLSHPGVHTAIIGTTNPDNARKNIAFANKGPLSPEQVAQIRQAFREADPSEKWIGMQ
ncbi:aldo/keto reductase [Humisphaera borealis]|uniref:Aldo/keto reductase n=1 Tax=Humisphaera borealis TaxID=2807512 RepID=A0A7M2X2U6_9BACT|nr:aldo/keto reductase [Humisphaera borealis]QOV91752.1 aldo/keto reductase [Humisphaera borealis]